MWFDKLKVYVPQDGPYGLEPEEGGEPVEEETCHLKSDVDAVIAELKDERDAFEKSLNEMTEAFMQSQRALWLARANSARNKVRFFGWAFDCYDIYTLINIDGHKYKMPRQNRLLACHHWIEIFENVERLCQAKAEKYK